jgi:putative SOS response-associated peptidase YedK
MCGRYVRRGDKQKIAEYFHANPRPAELPMPDEDFNVAPTTYQPIIRQSRELATGKWCWPDGVWSRSLPRI